MNYKKIGLAFCVGLADEAQAIYELFREHFQVYTVCCKICGIDKDEFQLEKIDTGGGEAMCNPLGQAAFLNQKKTDLNVIIGLCIGHDILFSEHSNAPVTTLAVKDRVLAHNPLGAIYSPYYPGIKSRAIIRSGWCPGTDMTDQPGFCSVVWLVEVGS